MNARAFESKIKALRESLESNAPTVGEIPAFDLAAAHEIYDLLLKPVEAGWKPAKKLIVVTNGALGLLPLSLLPTEAAAIKSGCRAAILGLPQCRVAGENTRGDDGAVRLGLADVARAAGRLGEAREIHRLR